MKKRKATYIFVFIFMLIPFLAFAQMGGVALGVTTGVAFPHGSSPTFSFNDWSPAFNWGFFVNIPLIYSFQIAPTSELYRIGSSAATDIGLAFKFVVPLGRINLYTGLVPGITAAGDRTSVHIGALAGAEFRLISNIGLFGHVKYKIAFVGNENYRVLHAHVGILFYF